MQKSLYPSLLAGWRFLLSFRKRKWSLEDYPIVVRKQSHSSQPLGKTGQWTLAAYHAQIVNWTLSGSGETAAAAMESLRERFNHARENRPLMPRPGTRVPIEFASRKRIEANSALAAEFLESVLGHGEAWISDESSLWDFALGHSLDDYYAKIRALYDVDVSDVPGGNLAGIIERIAQSKQKQLQPDGKP
ncbi:MAG: hypothetical protein ABSG60_14120 [Terracidiphilus sp.]|jgi:hypothetical protein